MDSSKLLAMEAYPRNCPHGAEDLVERLQEEPEFLIRTIHVSNSEQIGTLARLLLALGYNMYMVYGKEWKVCRAFGGDFTKPTTVAFWPVTVDPVYCVKVLSICPHTAVEPVSCTIS
jgi:hypothetical protein